MLTQNTLALRSDSFRILTLNLASSFQCRQFKSVYLQVDIKCLVF